MAEKDAVGCGIEIASEAITNIRTVASLSKLFHSIQSNNKNNLTPELQGKKSGSSHAFQKKWKIFRKSQKSQ